MLLERNEPTVTDQYRPKEGADAFLSKAVRDPDEIRERFLSFIAHEMRNPMASGLWASEMLARRPSDPARVERLGSLALRSVRRLRTLFEDFFALERLPANPPPGRVDLSEAVDRALGPHDLESKGLEATVEGPSDLVAPLDPATFDRLLHSCARRLTRVSPNGGPLRIRFERVDSLPEALLSFERSGVEARAVEPPLLTPGGSEGEGTTFTLFVARVAAQRLGVAMWLEDTSDGCALRLRIPLER